MHSVKKAARKSAWYAGEDDGVKTYNPFGRTSNKPRRKRDEEAGGLYHANTENDAVPSPVAEQRRQQFQGDNDEKINGVAKAGTFPAGPSGGLPRRSNERYTEPIETSRSSEGNTSKNVSSEDSGPVEKSVGPGDGEGKPRKRKMRKFMPWKKNDEPEEELDRAETEDSKKKNWPKPTIMGQVRAVFLSWINILLIAVPVGIALNYAGVNKIAVFVVNFIAIIPLAAMLSFATEELALYVGEVLGGLLNATFGNAVELIVSIIALIQHKILIVQTSLIGSMLSNLLLVLGMCFFLGGINRKEQFFNVTVAQTAASLLALAIGSLIIPTASRIFASVDTGIAPTSRGTSVLLLVTYGCYLLFQLRTHTDMYNEPSQKAPKLSSGKKSKGDASKGIAAIGAGTGAAVGASDATRGDMFADDEEEGEVPQLTRLGALVTLAGSTVLVALCAEFMVSAIDAVAEDVPEEFIGLILLPIVGNAAEHATAVTVAIKDKMDLSIGVACGSSLQIALLVLPFMVLLNWFGVGALSPGDPQWISAEASVMTLAFDGFQVSVLFISVVIVNYLIQDGKSHWLEGVLLMITYMIIALAAWFYKADGEVAG
ncbi:uncharacterized protein LTR77_009337 [Saxophila tyrrhenica]|uniref:Sodium/calcium exchanger membrane region domain-containing protein n=1 Tax=Saxophila tyrrhenica TaxID=1690608 RepID=A0AAV9NYS8_9PEZI|nr:hypothetical protein LTR77_009337 [Saxophila tyrrhenica]